MTRIQRTSAAVLLVLHLILFATAAEEPPFTYNGWTSGNFWGGGYVQNVVLCPSKPDRCYAYIDMAGVYRSDDKGNTWRMLHGAFPNGVGYQIRGLSVDPRNADHFITVVSCRQFGKGFLLASCDGGKTFRIVGRIHTDNGMRRTTGFIIDRNPQNPDEIMVGGNDGVMKSSDNGKTWNSIWTHSLNPTDLRYDRTNPSRIWLCSPLLARWKAPSALWKQKFDVGFFRTEDGGKTWVKLSSESPSELVQSCSNPGELYALFNYETVKRSTDNGKTWTDYSRGLNKETVKYHDKYCNKNIYTALGAGKDFLVVASTLKDFYRLDHGSDEWKRIDIRKVDPRDYLGAHIIDDHAFKATGSITIDPYDQNHWYATDYYNVLQTFDAGENWICTSTGMSQVVMKSAFVLPGTRNFLVTLMDHSWYLSKDGGETFTPYPGFGYERNFFQVAPSDPGTIYASGPRASTVSVSHDGGKTWKVPRQQGLPNRQRYYVRGSIAVDQKNKKTVYLAVSNEFADGEGGGVYVSRDAGENWTRMSEGLPDLTYHKGKGFFENTNVCGYELAVSKAGTPVCMSIVYNHVCRWNKEKGRWETVRSDKAQPWGLADLQADPFFNRLWLAARKTGLLFSDDDGRTWEKLETFPGIAGRLYFDREKAGRFTVSANEGVYFTEDGGKNWWFYDFDRTVPGRSINAVVAVAGEDLLLATQESGVFYHHIRRNPDGSPKGFIRKKVEKEIHRTSAFSTLFGWGTLRVSPGGAMFETTDGKHRFLFSIPGDGILRVECSNAERYVTIGTAPLSVKKGKKYRLEFQVRGDVKLIGYFNDPERRNFLNSPLNAEWRNFSLEVVPRSDRLSVALVNWRQKGWFEIRNFKLSEE